MVQGWDSVSLRRAALPIPMSTTLIVERAEPPLSWVTTMDGPPRSMQVNSADWRSGLMTQHGLGSNPDRRHVRRIPVVLFSLPLLPRGHFNCYSPRRDQGFGERHRNQGPKSRTRSPLLRCRNLPGVGNFKSTGIRARALELDTLVADSDLSLHRCANL